MFLFLSTLIYGQNNYRHAYIVTQENDTVYGYVNFRSDILNLSECLFKKNIEDIDSKAYLPSDIAGYAFIEDNKIYVSQKIKIDDSEKQVFLEYLVKGESASLYFYEYKEMDNYSYVNRKIFVVKDIYGDLNVISKQDDQLVSGSTIKKDVAFRNELFKILGYHADMQPILKKTEFSRQSLTNAIKKYNDMTCDSPDACVVYKASTKVYLKFNYAFYVGARMFKLTEFNPALDRINPENYVLGDANIKPEIGAQLMLSYPRVSNSLSLVIDISFSQMKQNFSHKSRPEQHYKLSATTLDVGLGLKYIHPTGKLRPGGGFGIGKFCYLGKKLDGTILANSRDDFDDWVRSPFIDYYANLSLDYMLKNNHSAFFQLTYSSDFEPIISPDSGQKRYVLGARLGYRF